MLMKLLKVCYRKYGKNDEGQQSIGAEVFHGWGNWKDNREIAPPLCMLKMPCNDHVEL